MHPSRLNLRFLPYAASVSLACAACLFFLHGCTDSDDVEALLCDEPAQLDENLVRNGDAELGPAGDGRPQRDGYPARPVCWERTSGCFTAATYVDAPGGFDEAPAPDGGRNFFSGGRPCDDDSDDSSGLQTLDEDVLASIRSDIATGTIAYTLSADLGGYESQDDSATVVLTFLDLQGDEIARAELEPVLGEDRGDNTGFVRRSVSGVVPEQTASITIRTTMVRDEGNNNDGAVDNIELIFRAP